MLKPKDLRITPKLGFTYRQPETGKEFVGYHPKAFLSSIFQYRLSVPELNLDTTGNWQDRVWNDYCLQHPECECEDTQDRGSFPNLADIWNCLQTFTKWKLRGGGFVDQSEAERRANVCLSGANGHPCPNNKPSGLCFGCKGVSHQIRQLIDGRKTAQDDQLYVCQACKCDIGSKLWFPLDTIVTDQSKLPEHCWQKQPS